MLMPFEVQSHTVPNSKALSNGKYEPRGLYCGSTLNICQGVLRSGNLLYTQGFVLFPMVSTVSC